MQEGCGCGYDCVLATAAAALHEDACLGRQLHAALTDYGSSLTRIGNLSFAPMTHPRQAQHG